MTAKGFSTEFSKQSLFYGVEHAGIRLNLRTAAYSAEKNSEDVRLAVLAKARSKALSEEMTSAIIVALDAADLNP